MTRASAAAIVAIALLVSPVTLLAQSAGGPSAGSNSAPAPGTNSADNTAQSSGAGVNSGSGVTTGSAGSLGTGTAATRPQESTDAAINAENKTIDRKLKGICRGC